MIADNWGLGDLSTATALIVSEFVTNAIRASTGQYDGQDPNSRPLDAPPPIELRLFSDKRQILIEVWDAADGQPTVRPIDPLEESGRGLLLVERLSTAWGSTPATPATPATEVTGKFVWARVTEHGLTRPRPATSSTTNPARADGRFPSL